MKKLDHFWRPALFLGILALFLGGVSWLFVPKDNTTEAGFHDVRSYGYLAEPTDSLDVFILGDSIPKYGIIPGELWNSQGITAYVCAPMGETAPKLAEIAADVFKNQSPAMVVLETNLLFERPAFGYRERLWAERVFPVLRYHDNWKFVRPRQMIRPVEYTWTPWEKGYYLNKTIEAHNGRDYMRPLEVDTPIDPVTMDCVKEIQALCQRNGSRLLLLSMPCASNMTYERHETLTRVSQELGIPYIDMNLNYEAFGLDWSMDTPDSGEHLNYWGAKKTTLALGTYLAQTGLFADHRGEAGFDAWEEAYQKFCQVVDQAHGVEYPGEV